MVQTQPAPRIAVTIPYRPDGERRERNFHTVVEHFTAILPISDIIPIDTDHEPFNRAGARNAAVDRARDYDVIVICDADTILETEPLHSAINAALTDGLVHNPFTIVQALSQGSSSRWCKGNRNKPSIIFTCDWGVGSAYVTTPQAWWDIGGQDERFTGWGFEDTSFAIAHRTLKTPMPRHHGTATQLWHPPAPREGSRHYDAGVEHFAAYLAADGHAGMIQDLIRGN
jgi:hypothetical protein